MTEQEWLSDTRRVSTIGNKVLCVAIKKEIANALGIVKGMVVEVKFRNTYKMSEPINRKKKDTSVSPVESSFSQERGVGGDFEVPQEAEQIRESDVQVRVVQE